MKKLSVLKKRAAALICAFCFMLNAGGCSAAQKNITVTYEGEKINYTNAAFVKGGRVMVPLRQTLETMGIYVKWDDENQCVYAKKGSKMVCFTLNSNEMTIDNGKTDENGNKILQTIQLDTSPTIENETSYMPLRAVSEAFDMLVDWDENGQTAAVTKKANDEAWKENTGSISLENLSFTGNGVSLSDKTFTVTEGGDYTVSGSMSGGSIVVDSTERVKLRLNNVSMKSDDAPCIYIKNADKAYITLEGENTLESSAESTILSKDNLVIKGSGSLSIQSGGHGIKSTDSLEISNGNITVNAQKDAINVNDTFLFSGGSLSLEAVCDGIDSSSIVDICGGKLEIKTTLEPTITQSSQNSGFLQQNSQTEFASSAKGIKADWLLKISDGDISVNSTDHAVHCADEIDITGGKTVLSSEYAKGISGHGNVNVGGDCEIDIEKSTEGIESKNILKITGGKICITASDDALNGGGTQGIEQGAPQNGRGNGQENVNEGEMPPAPPSGDMNIEPPQSFNEEQNTDMPPRDENRNNKDSEMPPQENGNMRPPRRMMQNGEENAEKMQRPEKSENRPGMQKQNLKDVLIVTGGDIELSAGDDCLDANGNLIITGGIIKATKTHGSVCGVEAVLDADGTVTIEDGATLIAAAASGADMGINNEMYSITVYTREEFQSTDKIELKDKSGNVICEYMPAGNYSAVYITSPKIKENESYTLSAGDEIHTVTPVNKDTVIGTKKQSVRGFGR